ncbi:hypothetical protein [Campylobacter sp. MIT 99-7217]|nr:hypothetical protein [Campylobacter sp. MIT 99-7217]
MQAYAFVIKIFDKNALIICMNESIYLRRCASTKDKYKNKY